MLNNISASWVVAIKTIIIVITIETMIMTLLPFMPMSLGKTSYAVGDALLLGILLAPALYYLVVRPLKRATESEERIRHQLHDTLTGLAKEPVLCDVIEHEINAAKRNNYSIALIVIDPSRLSEVNQMISHKAGDIILKQISERILSLCRSSDVLSRLSGDEFAIMLPKVGLNDAATVESKIREAFANPFTVNGGTKIDISIVTGTALFPEHASTAEELIKHADIALAKAKKERVSNAVFDANDKTSIQHNFELFGALRAAISNKELKLVYQPKIDLKSNSIVGVESLIRWPGVHGRSPAEFIPFAEKTGLIGEITIAVLEEAIVQCKKWLDAGEKIPVSINISARNLYDSNLIEMLVSTSARYELSPSMVTIEVTESSIMARPETAIQKLHELRGHGFGIALDDFGTGYSSLAYLKNIPATELKLDRSFVIEILENKTDHAVLESVIALAAKLGLTSVAEGVETQAIANELQRMGCSTIQGYYYSKPLPPNDYFQWHKQWNTKE